MDRHDGVVLGLLLSHVIANVFFEDFKKIHSSGHSSSLSAGSSMLMTHLWSGHVDWEKQAGFFFTSVICTTTCASPLWERWLTALPEYWPIKETTQFRGAWSIQESYPHQPLSKFKVLSPLGKQTHFGFHSYTLNSLQWVGNSLEHLQSQWL
jgi:hypothetical protein